MESSSPVLELWVPSLYAIFLRGWRMSRATAHGHMAYIERCQRLRGLQFRSFDDVAARDLIDQDLSRCKQQPIDLRRGEGATQAWSKSVLIFPRRSIPPSR